MQLLHILNDLLQTGRNGKAAAVGALTEEYVKIGNPVLIALLEITLSHGQFVEVAEHGHIEFVIYFHWVHLSMI